MNGQMTSCWKISRNYKMFELLAEPIRKFIRDQRWESLRPIQNAAIKHMMGSAKHYILASRTASGKTEAAFLPVLSRVDFNTVGVKVVYISPLIALINDQFNRVEQLCEYLDVTVTKWHGEANKTKKEKLIKSPSGVLLITPESLEAMFANKPHNIRHLFGSLSYVIIDEIHSFIGTNRGLQLQSLLYRLQLECKGRFQVIGLSATIGDFQAVKAMTGEPEETVVLRDKSAKEMEAHFKYYEGEGADLPLNLLKDLYLNVQDHKVLIFPNSRGRAEEIAVKLKKISNRVGGHPYYFSHHSSVDRELREYIEQFVKTNRRYPFAIACTSTLELGIDIGSVDKVVQVDATSSIASLIQRVGRSGRKDGMTSSLLFYATGSWSLVQSLACYSLYRDGFIEPVYASAYAYDIFLHQMLSTVKQLSGCTFDVLKERMLHNHAFKLIDETALVAISRELLKKDFLELVGNDLIIGMEGERIVNSRDFYSVFKTDPNYKVVQGDKTIGEIPLLSIIDIDENILLAAKIWKVVDIDDKSKKIAVIPAKDGKKPKFFGSGMEIHPRIRERMLELLVTETQWPELDPAAAEVLSVTREQFSRYQVEDLAFDRPVLQKESECILYTFQGTRINKSLHFILNRVKSGDEIIYDEESSSFSFRADIAGVRQMLALALASLPCVDDFLDAALRENQDLISYSKWGIYLPVSYQKYLLKQNFYDFESLEAFLVKLNLISREKTIV
jgi:ATP-dependent Lhr-like helicase